MTAPSTGVPASVEIDRDIAGKRLLILGAGLWQVEYIRRARRLGAETWATDWSDDAVGKPEADHFAPIDVTHAEETLAFAKRARIEGVFTAADVAVPTAAFLAAEMGLPGYSPAVAAQATNKLSMRRRSEEIGLKCPWFRPVRSVAEASALAAALSFPAIVKPVDNCSSRGVRFVAAPDGLAAAVAEALDASRAGEALIEEFLVGTEGSVEALVQDGRVVVLGACDKTKSALPYRYDLELRYPGAYDAATRRDVDALAMRIAEGFGIADGILHIEFLVAADTRHVYLIEFAVRGCGSKVCTHLMPRLTGIDVVRVLIRQAFGLSTASLDPARHLHGALHFLMFPPGRVTAVRGVDEARSLPGVIDACVERVAGETIDEVRDGRSRPGHLLVSGATAADVQRTIAGVRDLIEIDYEHVSGVKAE
jgi:biotin carboxylase